jgi:hypothetical protein
MNYRKINNLTGWIVGGIALCVYLMTMEPTVSYWDCGEFLSCAYKLEVGHSPGAPLFMMLQRMFGMFASKENAALYINAFSAVVSALTILFLFWTITYFAKKLIAGSNDAEPEKNQTFLIMGAGIVGGLAYTFSDTFWFSAVEAEVYATSSFFTAISFWAALKWEAVAHEKHADRWLLLIAYMVGLSVGVHLLNLLIIPAVAIIYYFKRYNVTKMGTVVAFVVGCVILAFVQFGVIQGIPKLAFMFDRLFVNSFGTSFDFGAIFFLLLVVAALVWLLMFAKKKGNYLLHTGTLCILFILIGFSCYIVPVIRSRADVAIDMTNPDDANRFLSYVNREQFGSQPLLFGPDYTSRVTEYEKTGDAYAALKNASGKDEYVVVGKKVEPRYETTRFFPRIWDGNDAGHADFYRNFLGLEEGEQPSSGDNISFFMGYQMNWMWWRYFMWNYAGRQNDYEGQGAAKDGNWITGIKMLDKPRVGDMDKMSDSYRNNRARNELYLLPLILGVLGLVYQFNRDKRNGFIVFLLFFFTGIAIGIYLNMTPEQPRERDYAFAGATYAFAIWIGLGVLMVHQWLRKAAKDPVAAFASIVLCLVAVPALMAKEEWDDHDRSKKTLARASAYNALVACDSNAILFTYGDNDTYPLWYLQEVEGFRTDVRIINTSLLGIDWYIDQLNYKINDADAVPMLWTRDKYLGDRSNVIPFMENPKIAKDRYFNLEEICNFMADDNPANKVVANDETSNYMPTKNFFVNTPSKEQLIKDRLLSEADSNKVSTDLRFTLNKTYLRKDQVAMMNIVAAVAKGGWKRPIYFGGMLPGDNYLNMTEYLRMDGVVSRLMPFKYVDSVAMNMPSREPGFVNLDKCVDLYLNKFQWGNAQRNDVYYDEKNRLTFYAYRLGAPRVAEALLARGRKDDAMKVLDKVMASISEKSFCYDQISYRMVSAYYQLGAFDKGRTLLDKIVKASEDDINWIMSLSDNQKVAMFNSLQDDFAVINTLGNNAGALGDTATGKAMMEKLRAIETKVQANMGPLLQQAQQQQRRR